MYGGYSVANTFDEILRKAVDLSYDERVQTAKSTLEKCLGILKKQGLDDEYAIQFIVSFLAASIAADGKFTESEQQMIRDTFDDRSVSSIDVLVQYTDEECFEGMDQFVDSLDAAEKTDFCMLAVFVAAADDTVNEEELRYLVKLMQ